MVAILPSVGTTESPAVARTRSIMRPSISPFQRERRRRFTRVRQVTQVLFMVSGLAAAALVNYFTDAARTASAATTTVTTTIPATPANASRQGTATRPTSSPTTTPHSPISTARPVTTSTLPKAVTPPAPLTHTTTPATPITTRPPAATPTTTAYTPPQTVPTTTVHVPICTTTPSGVTTCV